MSNLSLFDPAPSAFPREQLARRLAALAGREVWIGTSSWKYPGWLDQIYTPALYATRGRHSKARFEAECLREFAGVFPTVCGDFAFYQFPAPSLWENLFARVPEGFRFTFKVPEQITRLEFPMLARYGRQAGERNPNFLDADLFHAAFLGPLTPYRERLGVLILEFGAMNASHLADPGWFFDALGRFMDTMPPGLRFGVEIRNPELLQPAYFDCLRSLGVAHTFNSWTRMPDLASQLAIPEAVTADFTVCRALLRPGRSYERAVEAFSPYREVQDPYEEAREALRALVRRDFGPAFVYVNNRFEGNAPLTIEAVLPEESES